MRNQNWCSWIRTNLQIQNWHVLIITFMLTIKFLVLFPWLCLVLPCSWSLFSCFTATAKWSLLENQCLDAKLGLSFSHHVSLTVYSPILSAIGESQNVGCFFCMVPQEVLTSYTVLNNLVVLSLQVRELVPVSLQWDQQYIIKARIHSGLNWPLGPELGSRNLIASHPLRKLGLRLNLIWLPSQTGHFCSSVICGRYSENVLCWNTIPWLLNLVSVHPFLLILRSKVASCCTKCKIRFEWLLNDWC